MFARNLSSRNLTASLMKRGFSAYDLCVVGGGPGGYVAAIRAAQNGLKTVCIEGRGALGGTCLNVGCIPSKSLLNVSHKYHEMAHADDYGLVAKDVGFDWTKVLENKEKVVAKLTGGIKGLLMKNKVDYVEGWGKLEGNGKVSVPGFDTIEAKNILIATGSEPTPFPGIEFDEKVFVSSTGALALEKVPETLTIVGAGVIGLELGSVYARFGTKVTVVEFADRACPFMDSEISKLFQRSLKKQGINFMFNTAVQTGKVVDGRAELEVKDTKKDKLSTISSDVCLIAIGRRPFTGGLDCEAAGVILNERGQIEINDHFQTSAANVYAIGDVVTGPMLAHKSEEEGVACVDLIAGKDGHINYNTIPSVVYTHPEVAWVGLTEEEAKEQGIETRKGVFPMSANSRANANMDTEGKVKIITDKTTGRMVGAHIIGDNAGELIGELVLGMEYGASAEDIARTCHAHPTLSEAIKEAALDASFKPIHC